jgi:hypothetical protein
MLMLMIAGGILLAVLGYYVIGFVASSLFLDARQVGCSVRRSFVSAVFGTTVLTLGLIAVIVMVRRFL